MRKLLEQQELIFHRFFEPLFCKVSTRYREEIFSKNSVFQAVETTIRNARDSVFKIFLGSIKPDSSIGHQVPKPIVAHLLISCLNHLKISNYNKGEASHNITQSVLSGADKIDISKVVNYLQTRNTDHDQRYSQLFQHIAEEYDISYIDPSAVFDPGNNIVPLNN